MSVKTFYGVLCSDWIQIMKHCMRNSPELKLFKHWVSLGEGHSLISPKDEDKEKGIPADFIRVAVGLENCDDLICDLEREFKLIFG
ncbi:MAG: PLP-dependent transferase [Coprococcus sp.]